MNNRILKVIVEQAEGLSADMVPQTYEGPGCVERANQHLCRIAANHDDLGYIKTDVTITLVDGSEFRFRFDVQPAGTDHNDTDIVNHAIQVWECYGGLRVPPVAQDKYTLVQWEARMMRDQGTESVMEMRRMLNVLRPPVQSQETAMDLALNRIFN